MNILCITHADFEGPGIIETWAKDRGHEFAVKRPYKGEKLQSDFDMLVIMGGPQSATKLDEYPYLSEELELTRKAIGEGKKVIGFCLGAQIIGAAMGAPAEQSPEKEVGIFPIHLTAEGKRDNLLSDLPDSFPVIHWHTDMPGLPDGSSVLAYSDGCPRQIVKFSRLVYGFQCHMEITHEGLLELVKAVPEDLTPSTFTQNKNALFLEDLKPINKMMVKLLDRFNAGM